MSASFVSSPCACGDAVIIDYPNVRALRGDLMILLAAAGVFAVAAWRFLRWE